MVKIGKFLFDVLIFIQSLIILITPSFNGKTSEKVSIDIDPGKKMQTVDGFGATACWWAQVVGNSEYAEEITKLIYGKEGLGLNIFRYNIGSGERDNPSSRLSHDSWKSTESFLTYNSETGKYEYDFTKDAGARKILDLALGLGCVDTVVLFSNSPHYSMTVTGQASGGFEAHKSNLKKECYNEYVDYILDITEYFLSIGVPVKYISPINEPQVSWGGAEVYQEGCYYEPQEVIELSRLFARGIKERQLPVKLSLCENSKIDNMTFDYLKKLYGDDEIRPYLGSYAYHSYWADENSVLKEKLGTFFKKNYPDVKREMSEWCELPCEHTTKSIESALIMARVISQDMSITGCNSWTAWGTVNEWDDYSDGLIVAKHDVSEYYIAKRYYALAHFSRFIPRGSVCIEAKKSFNDRYARLTGAFEISVGYKMNVSAFLTPEGKTVVVIVNEGNQKEVTLNTAGSTMTVYTTDSERNLENTYDGAFTALTVPENSITTVIISK